MSKSRLDKLVTLTVSADGTVTSVPVGPERYGDWWHVNLISMSSSGNSLDTAEFFVYRGSPNPSNQIDYTAKVAGDTSNTDVDLQQGEFMTFAMTGATPGTIVTVHVTGDLNGLR